MSRKMRALHRWLSIAFTATVTANFIGLACGYQPAWLYLLPLPPLLVLLLTGLYLFALPYLPGRRPGRAGSWEQAR